MLNGKFVCTQGFGSFMKKGKIYEFKDGITTYDNGYKSTTKVNSISEFNARYHTQIGMIEIPEPSKSLLKSGFRIVYKGSKTTIRYVLLESDSINDKNGHFCVKLSEFNDDLTPKDSRLNAEIVEIWDGDVLIAKRKEKSEAQLKLEELEKKQRELADEIAKVRQSL